MVDDGAKAGGPEFKIRPGDLKDAAPTFENQSKALKEALDKLKQSLTEAGSPWGGDKQGNEFAQAYNGPHDKVLSALDVLVKGLTSIHDGLVVHADNHTGADNHARKNMTP
ncbi:MULTISPECIES: WXG100 family type VII secretion target [unclassified Kitasatospora]|uniref:WXG100 family type VII secretion target n=1 Tax=unclassified Kitasatospora TaxID=2633591 RepID=UPI0033E9A385